MRPLTPTELRVLRVTSETEPRTETDVRILADISHTRRPVVYHVLRELKGLGLVADSASFPIRWLRTTAGTDLLAETKVGVAV